MAFDPSKAHCCTCMKLDQQIANREKHSCKSFIRGTQTAYSSDTDIIVTSRNLFRKYDIRCQQVTDTKETSSVDFGAWRASKQKRYRE